MTNPLRWLMRTFANWQMRKVWGGPLDRHVAPRINETPEYEKREAMQRLDNQEARVERLRLLTENHHRGQS